MRSPAASCGVLCALLVLPAIAHTQAKPPAAAPAPTPAPVMSDAQFITAAEGAAPATISGKAAIVRIDAAKKATTEVRAGTNGFTCSLIPDESNAPFCADKNGWAWMSAAFTGQPNPPNTVPGIAYMGKGGLHFETPTGDIVMMAGPGTKTVAEPPHWMLLSAIDPATSGLPTKPNAGGAYIMFAGTPYAHVMIYQNPAMLAK